METTNNEDISININPSKSACNHGKSAVIDFFKMGKSMLTIWGLWPITDLSPTWSKIYKAYGFFIIMVTLVPYNVFSVVDTTFQIIDGKWMDVLPRLSVALAMILGTLKVAVCAYNTTTIQKFMNTFENPDYKYEPSPFFKPDDIVRRCVWLYNIQTTVCVGLIGILIMTDVETYLKKPIIHSENTTVLPLPFINWLPFKYSVSPFYELSFLLTNFWFFVCAHVIFVYDTICMGQMIYTAGQLKIINLALKTLRPRAVYHLERNNYNGQRPSESLVNSVVETMFKQCAKHHQGVIRFVKDFQNLYSIIIFLQFITSCLMICFTILIVTHKDSAVSSRVTCLIILLCTMWELSVFCYFGNEIIYESNQLSMGIFMSEWFLLNQPAKKNVSIMLTRTQKPIVITVGRFAPLSLETFLMVLRAAYSYYAFLRNVSNE